MIEKTNRFSVVEHSIWRVILCGRWALLVCFIILMAFLIYSKWVDHFMGLWKRIACAIIKTINIRSFYIEWVNLLSHTWTYHTIKFLIWSNRQKTILIIQYRNMDINFRFKESLDFPLKRNSLQLKLFSLNWFWHS